MLRQLNSYLDLARFNRRSEQEISTQMVRLVQKCGIGQARGNEKPRALRDPRDNLKVALKRAAEQDERSMSTMAARILREWLTEHGFMDAGEARRAPRS